jgi:4-alpha-glucanotransferase
LWFEQDAPERWPEKAMAAVTTHDLPTIAGLWSGADLKDQHACGLQPNDDATEATRRHLRQVTGVAGDDAPPGEVVEAAYATLSRSPCLLLAATLDDALEVEERPNMPGTTDEWPNWSIALPVPLEEIESDRRPHRLAASLRSCRP